MIFCLETNYVLCIMDLCPNCQHPNFKENTIYLGQHGTFADAPDCIRCYKWFCIYCKSNAQGICIKCYEDGDSGDDDDISE